MWLVWLSFYINSWVILKYIQRGFFFFFRSNKSFHVFVIEPHRPLVRKHEPSGAKHSISPKSCSDSSDMLNIVIWLVNMQVTLTHHKRVPLRMWGFLQTQLGSPVSSLGVLPGIITSFHSNKLSNGMILLLIPDQESLDSESLVRRHGEEQIQWYIGWQRREKRSSERFLRRTATYMSQRFWPMEGNDELVP